jgi:hypothetical protein
LRRTLHIKSVCVQIFFLQWWILRAWRLGEGKKQTMIWIKYTVLYHGVTFQNFVALPHAK